MQTSTPPTGGADPVVLDEWEGLSAEDARRLEEMGYVAEGGWQIVDTTRGSDGWILGARDLGMTAHRGVLHPDEYVDSQELRLEVENALGFTFEEVHSVYRRGRLSVEGLELRVRLDARLLEVSEAGGNMAALGRVLGFVVDVDGECQPIRRALARARASEGVAA